MVNVWDLCNSGPRNSGEITLNGAAARTLAVGDTNFDYLCFVWPLMRQKF